MYYILFYLLLVLTIIVYQDRGKVKEFEGALYLHIMLKMKNVPFYPYLKCGAYMSTDKLHIHTSLEEVIKEFRGLEATLL